MYAWFVSLYTYDKFQVQQLKYVHLRSIYNMYVYTKGLNKLYWQVEIRDNLLCIGKN